MRKWVPVLVLGLVTTACGGDKVATTAPPPSPSTSTPGPGVATSAALVRAYVCEAPAYEPGELLIACGDGNARVTRLRWSSWTASRAVGTGIWQQNDCQPDCARGRFVDFPVQLVLYQPMSGQGTMIFGTATAVFPGQAPPGTNQGREVLMRNGAYAP